ncbi:glycosyl transferase [Spirochaetia bacterium]|nr:glycosyl transferase [Spirochaetia bacterium]
MKSNNMEIDFVIPWVDGSDPEWTQRFNQYSPKKKEFAIDINAERYRDGGMLRYWFRGIEKNASWVRKIFFITDGQLPPWLNLDNEKLVWIKHEDYIPQSFLPIFSSHPIELHIHRIKGLSDTFVYFNDDMYLINPVHQTFFFKNGLPCDSALVKCISPSIPGHFQFNDLIEISNHFEKKQVLRKHLTKFFNLKYDFFLQCMSLLFCFNRQFLGFYGSHMPQPYLKGTFNEVWKHCEAILIATSQNKFRNIADVNQYLFKFWQLVTGKFTPVNLWAGKRCFGIKMNSIKGIGKSLQNRKIKEICMNDMKDAGDCYPVIAELFNKKFPEKSSFEK